MLWNKRKKQAYLRLRKKLSDRALVGYMVAKKELQNGLRRAKRGHEKTLVVPPAPVKITQQSHFTLLCTTVGFFPKEFNITWYENKMEIMFGINTTIQQNKEGLYQVSSYLSPVQNALMYTCEVSHVSLKVPAIDSYTVLDQADTGTFPKELVAGCAVAGLLLLMLVTVVIPCKLDTIKGTGITPVNSRDNSQFEEQVCFMITFVFAK
ncbi:HLA class II histocompatibility antigen, DR beta 5 chain-like [Chiloscyllium plagiosum]|uniref:HLA class II histocompatibility antigen, DR beta 5 chain-like n=1 Tax=Chiloscyllium plagiosum TaxID=36176 RepID=UPI001CB7CF55|nr:HLA class II histocompatibility antigen, DR beta 5 chain-like [Chiloscyllium plagiosum]